MVLKTRNTAVFENFKGIDIESSILQVHKSRALSLKNFIYDNGINCKRNGWIEKFRIGKENINGIFECNTSGQHWLIIYTGKAFYRVEQEENGEYKIEDITDSSSYDLCKVNRERLLDKRCLMFVQNNKYYFIGCGDFLVYEKHAIKHKTINADGEEIEEEKEQYELRRVEDNTSTYIPLTTINIDHDGVDNDIRAVFEKPNMLSRWRKNTFVGASLFDIVEDPKDETTDKGEKEATIVEVESRTWTVDSGCIDENSKVTIEHERYNAEKKIVETVVYTNSNAEDPTKLYEEIEKETTSDNENTETREIEKKQVGTINFETGQITLTIDTQPHTEGEENMKILFSVYTTGYADRINLADNGILYGVNGTPDRLFVSGNIDYPNYDFYSESEDFSNFPDVNTSAVGNGNSAIVGYTRLGDGTLAVHKAELNGEAQIYYRTGTLTTDANDENGIVVNFPVTTGTLGEAMISKYANANLGSDKIFLSKNGVYGIVVSSSYYTNERYSKERSQFIRSEFKKHKDLSNAVAIVFDNKYYLAIDNICYIADGNLTSQSTSDASSFNYEWYIFDNMPVRVFAKIGGQLCFGTTDGRVCFFDKEYSDRTFERTKIGDLLLQEETGTVLYNANLEINKYSTIKFITDTYAEFLEKEKVIKVENNKIFVNEKDIMHIYNGTVVYVDQLEEDSMLEKGVPYIIQNVNLAECSFCLCKEDKQLELNSPFRLVTNIVNKVLAIDNITTNSFAVKLNKATQTMKLTNYANEEMQAELVIIKPVVAVWKTAVFDFGSNLYEKILLSLTLSTTPDHQGTIEFGYITRKSKAMLEQRKANAFDFDTLDFENFSFDSNFTSSFTVARKDYFNFIQFYFQSKEATPCSVNSLVVLYKVNAKNKGVN